MFKRFRRFLGECGVNFDLLVLEHVVENTFIFALIIGRSFVFDSTSYFANVNDWVLFNGPIMCFLFISIFEFSSLLRQREHRREEKQGTSSSPSSIDKHHHLFHKLEKINDLFFDGTASTIIFVSIFIFLHDYYFGAHKNQKVSLCDDAPNINQQEV